MSAGDISQAQALSGFETSEHQLAFPFWSLADRRHNFFPPPLFVRVMSS